METIMLNRYITAAILVTTLSCSHLAIAKFIRVSDSAQVDDLASETMTVWDIDNFSGKLQGAFNVNVGGTLWDVVFRDGSFSNLFSIAEAATIDDRTEGEAIDLSGALFDSVFVNGKDDEYLFNKKPALTRGCSANGICVAVTAFGTEFSAPGIKSRRLIRTINRDGSGPEGVARGAVLLISYDTGVDAAVVYAKWKESDVRHVPAPSTISIFALGLIGLAARRFNKQS
jgi:hypothetical protein